ncbi:MAG TPA: hypothetical protein VD908_18145 [Cytophagales bacterium]|nr:hypothetical protein [Cytophagales bacterium]
MNSTEYYERSIALDQTLNQIALKLPDLISDDEDLLTTAVVGVSNSEESRQLTLSPEDEHRRNIFLKMSRNGKLAKLTLRDLSQHQNNHDLITSEERSKFSFLNIFRGSLKNEDKLFYDEYLSYCTLHHDLGSINVGYAIRILLKIEATNLQADISLDKLTNCAAAVELFANKCKISSYVRISGLKGQNIAGILGDLMDGGSFDISQYINIISLKSRILKLVENNEVELDPLPLVICEEQL